MNHRQEVYLHDEMTNGELMELLVQAWSELFMQQRQLQACKDLTAIKQE